MVEEEIRLNLLVGDLLSIVLNVSSDDFTDGERETLSSNIYPLLPAHLLHAHGT